MAVAVEERLEAAAYRFVVNDRGKLEWHARIDGNEIGASAIIAALGQGEGLLPTDD